MADSCGVAPGWVNSSGTFTADGAPCERDCCFLLCRCWIDIRVNLHLSDSDRLWLLLPVSLGIALSGANMWQHRQAYLLRKRGGAGAGCLEAELSPAGAEAAGAALTPEAERRQATALALYLRMRLSFIAVLTAAPVLGAVAWAQLYFGGFHAEADAIVMVGPTPLGPL